MEINEFKMSIDYYFCCMKCRKIAYSFDHRGNTAIIDSFRFILKHTFLCGASSITLLHENDLLDLQCKDYPNCNTYEEDDGEDLNGYFPRSSEWEDHKVQLQKHLDYMNKDV